MRRHFGLIITLVVVLGVLIALSAAGNVQLDKPEENEFSPLRSTYNAGPTGVRAFYQMVEESGMKVSRWREGYRLLETGTAGVAGVTLISIGPFARDVSPEESASLRNWIAAGGHALIIGRAPYEQFGDRMIRAKYVERLPDWRTPPDRIEEIINQRSDELVVQPTELTRDLRGLALSEFATRMRFTAQSDDAKAAELPPPPPAPSVASSPIPTADNSPTGAPSPTPSATPTATPDDASEYEEEETEEFVATLNAPVVHLGDSQGAVLADFNYGQGRVVFLSDPFVVANNGVGRGANLQLALNLVRALGAPERELLFDEYHHGYFARSNPVLSYFRGTPLLWLAWQGALLCLLLAYTQGRRFARALPLPQEDRNSPLEFVGSMANLQQAADARDLALENIYPRFKSQLCRRLGLSSLSHADEIAAACARRGMPLSEAEIRRTLAEGAALAQGGAANDQRMIELVANMRRLLASLK